MKLHILLLLLLIPSVLAVNIKGTVYDFELNQVSNAIVEINSSPAQKIVAKNGEYSFDIPTGIYSISARSNGLSITEEGRALNEGEYVLDLILLTSFEEEEELLAQELSQEINAPAIEELFESKPTSEWALWVLAFAI